MRKRTNRVNIVGLLFLLALMPADATKANKANQEGQKQAQNKTVYVCACLKTKSCSCMTEAKMEGPCACGTQGGPPMKAVSPDSDWARENRDALAKQ